MKRGARGFTLFELIVVMIIAAALMAMVVPSLGGFRAHREVNDKAAGMLAVMNWARQRAIADGRPYRLNVDTAAREYWLTRQEGAPFVEVAQDMGRHFAWSLMVELSVIDPPGAPTPVTITFHPDGSADAATLQFVGRDGVIMRLALDPATGRYALTSAGVSS